MFDAGSSEKMCGQALIMEGGIQSTVAFKK